MSTIGINVLSYFSFLMLILASYLAGAPAEVRPHPPAVFIFGDSIADVGTNNLVDTIIQANYPHYGIDFPNHEPTGRFTNGYNVMDEVVRLMGYEKSPPPYLNLTHGAMSRYKSSIQTGVSFASGAAGILDDTEASKDNSISFRNQIKQFVNVRIDIAKQRGETETKFLLSKSLFLFSIGSNDIYLYDHILLKPYSFEEFATLYLSAYAENLKILYELGARKFGFIGIPLLGCAPSHRALNHSGGCLEKLNGFAEAINADFTILMQNLSSELNEMKYSIGNSYEMHLQLVKNPEKYGIKNIEEACCGAGRLGGKLSCLREFPLCPNRDEYLFFDFYHPSQVVCRLVAQVLYSETTQFVSPINFSQLLLA